MEQDYVMVDGKRLRRGYTTGSCAAAAALGAARMLFSPRECPTATIAAPGGRTLTLELREGCRGEGWAACAVRKDAGDDPDVTQGVLVFARVEKTPGPGIAIDGGEGVGRVTRPGLEQPVGAAAINRVPREMIAQAVKEAAREAGWQGGLRVTISVPGGEELAQRTFNPRLGIRGGISILGTSGIVEPMSAEALTASIRVELQVLAAAGERAVVLTPGSYGRSFLREATVIPDRLAVKCSNYVGRALEDAVELGFEHILLVGHLGKFVKLAGGVMDTHSRQGDCRMEILTAHAALAGAGRETAAALMDCITTDEAADILAEAGLLEPVMATLMEKIHQVLRRKAGEGVETGAMVFSNRRGLLGQTAAAPRLLTIFEAMEEKQ